VWKVGYVNLYFVSGHKRVYYRTTILFIGKALLAEIPYTYYDWFRASNYDKRLYKICIYNYKRREVRNPFDA
jgi:hypothetical protein